jgi:hypothetical protein
MTLPEFPYRDLQVLVENKVISTSEQNLRSKMDSLIRSIKNLEEKRSRIDYELKKQKSSLARKRMELKKDSKHSKARLSTALEEGVISRKISPQQIDGANVDDYLLRESALILDD